MTATEDLPDWYTLSTIFDQTICPSKGLHPVVWEEKKKGFHRAYRRLHKKHGSSKDSLQYLEIMLRGESLEVRKRALALGKNLLDVHTSPTLPTHTSREPKSVPFRERFRRFMEPSDVDRTVDTDKKEKEVAS